MRARAKQFRYAGLEISGPTLRAHYEIDGRQFVEEVTVNSPGTLEREPVRAVAELWYLVAGLSYYKAGAAYEIDFGATAVGAAGQRLFEAVLRDGLGEFSYRNELPLDDVAIVGGTAPAERLALGPNERVLTAFGGGIDSVVTTTHLAPTLDQSLFIISPVAGTFEPLEKCAAVTGLPVLRATRQIDPAIVRGEDSFFHGHVPVTAMVTLLAATVAVANERGGVVMSNEHSASVPNFQWRGRAVNHQWSKSWAAEQLIADAVAERVGDGVVIASFLRDRSELWVAREFAALTSFHHSFRSCNRAFAQERDRRAATWCGECDKCLFIHLVLAPFMERAELASILGCEPLADPGRLEQLRTLVGLGEQRKPFECVGDPDESAVALLALSRSPSWRHEANVASLAPLLSPNQTLDELMEPQGVSRVPVDWIR